MIIIEAYALRSGFHVCSKKLKSKFKKDLKLIFILVHKLAIELGIKEMVEHRHKTLHNFSRNSRTFSGPQDPVPPT